MGLQMSTELKPLIVSVKEARRLLGGCGHNRFWQLVKQNAFELVGTEHKRFVVVESLERYVASMPRRQSAAAHDDEAAA